MRKVFLFIFVMIFLFGLISAGKIVLNSPIGGENWVIGSIQKIKWNSSGLKNLLKITLWRNNSLIGLIVKNMPKSGVYTWKVGSLKGGIAPIGSEYKIKIREQGGSKFMTEDISNIPFKIVDKKKIQVSLERSYKLQTRTLIDDSLIIKKEPIIEIFKLDPVGNYYKYLSKIVFKFRNCEKVRIKAPDGKEVYSWNGNISEVKYGAEYVQFPWRGQNPYKIEAISKYGVHKLEVIGKIIPYCDKKNGGFKIINGYRKLMKTWIFAPGEKIQFYFEFTGASLAYIKKYDFKKKIWVQIVKIINPGFFQKSGTYKHTHDGKEGKYRLELIGDKANFTTKEIRIF